MRKVEKPSRRLSVLRLVAATQPCSVRYPHPFVITPVRHILENLLLLRLQSKTSLRCIQQIQYNTNI